MLIKNANIVTQDKVIKGDIRIVDGIIEEIDASIRPFQDERIIDAKSKYLLPKLVDTNVRLLDDTLSAKNLDKLLKAAKNGGVGRFVLIDDFTPRIENSTQLELLNDTIGSKSNNSKITISVNSLNKDKKLNNLATFLNRGAKVIYTRSDIDGNLLVRVMQYAGMKNRPIFCFCEDESIKNKGVINEGELSFKLGLPGISKIAQIAEVSKVVELATFFNVRILFQGISTSKSVQILRAVKKSNKNVFTEVPLHNLILDETECDNFNTEAKLIAPLREKSEKEEMIRRLKNGDIDVITSLHSPKSYIYKDVAFEEAKEGADTMELTLKLAYTYLVKNSVIDFSTLSNLISTAPAKILGIDHAIKVGNKAEMILFDTEHKYTIDKESSLYRNKEVYGKIYDIGGE
ncbi:MAG: dihydroorotase [Epsilonproteobacteria bacterium]|nr:dihydroorotase [Campylobacterota bacterium]